MAENEYGMRVYVELIAQNAKDIEEDIKDRLKSVNVKIPQVESVTAKTRKKTEAIPQAPTGIIDTIRNIGAEFKKSRKQYTTDFFKPKKPNINPTIQSNAESTMETTKDNIAKAEGAAPKAGGLFAGMNTKAMMGMATKLGIIVGAIAVIGVGITKLVQQAVKSSPYLQGILNVFGKAMSIFFRPFGDFLAILLRPLAIALLKMAIGFLKWTRTFMKPGTNPMDMLGNLMDKIRTNIEGIDWGKWMEENIPKMIVGLFNLGVWLGERLGDFIKGTFNFGVWLGERLADILWGFFDFGQWLGSKLADYIKGTFDIGAWLEANFGHEIAGAWNFGEWIGSHIADLITGTFDFGKFGEYLHDYFTGTFDLGKWMDDHFGMFISAPFKIGEWLGARLADFFIGVFNFGLWLGDNLANFVKGIFNFGVWLGENLAGYVKGLFNLGEWLGGNFANFITGKFDIGAWIKGMFPSGSTASGKAGHATGLNYVPDDGMYKLHKGEQVVNSPRSEKSNKSSVVNINNNFNISGAFGGGFGMDSVIDSIKMSTRLQELELRSRGVI